MNGTQMNGKTTWPQPLWPPLLTISYQLKENFTFTVTGTLTSYPKSLTVSLETGSNILDENIVCQLAAKFNENKLYVGNRQIENEEGLEDSITAGDLLNGSNFDVRFGCRGDFSMEVYTRNSSISLVDLNNSIDNIRYISVDGNVQSVRTLSYNFGDGLRGDQIYALPEWPRPKWPNENSVVLLIPRPLQSGNVIAVSGTMMNIPNSLKISLVTDQSNTDNKNIACQLDANFNDDTLQLNSVVYGQLQDVSKDKTTTARDLLSGLNFNISLACRSNNGENFFHVSKDNSYVDEIVTGHDFSDIRYIVLEGNIEFVKTLEFIL